MHISSFTQLKRLIVSCTSVTHLGEIFLCRTLECLDLSYTRIVEKDLEGIKDLVHLQCLSVSGCKLLTGLGDVVFLALHDLDISNTMLSNDALVEVSRPTVARALTADSVTTFCRCCRKHRSITNLHPVGVMEMLKRSLTKGSAYSWCQFIIFYTRSHAAVVFGSAAALEKQWILLLSAAETELAAFLAVKALRCALYCEKRKWFNDEAIILLGTSSQLRDLSVQLLTKFLSINMLRSVFKLFHLLSVGSRQVMNLLRATVVNAFDADVADPPCINHFFRFLNKSLALTPNNREGSTFALQAIERVLPRLVSASALDLLRLLRNLCRTQEEVVHALIRDRIATVASRMLLWDVSMELHCDICRTISIGFRSTSETSLTVDLTTVAQTLTSLASSWKNPGPVIMAVLYFPLAPNTVSIASELCSLMICVEIPKEDDITALGRILLRCAVHLADDIGENFISLVLTLSLKPLSWFGGSRLSAIAQCVCALSSQKKWHNYLSTESTRSSLLNLNAADTSKQSWPHLRRAACRIFQNAANMHLWDGSLAFTFGNSENSPHDLVRMTESLALDEGKYFSDVD